MSHLIRYETVFIGAGNMGGAILQGALDVGAIAPGSVLVVDASAERRRTFEQVGVATSDDTEAVLHADVVVLAVKPQVFPAVAETIGGLDDDTLVISVMAGCTSASIREALGGAVRVVRAMPNTPAQVRRGVTALAPGEGAEGNDLANARALFAPLGAVVEVEESMMDAVTATSGSGPAYVFHMAEHWIAGAIEMGLEPDVARTLVVETIRGAAALLREEDADPEALRHAVTSPGGTTAAGLAVLDERGTGDAIRAALIAARDRGRELSG